MMWKYGFLFALLAMVAQASILAPLTSSNRLQILPGMDLDFSGLTWSTLMPTVASGFGMFNLGTDVNRMVFSLQTQESNYLPETLSPENILSFTKSSWDKNQKTIIVIHGYSEDASGGPMSVTKKIATAYTQMNRPENIVFVDWHQLGRQLNYFTSADNTGKAGLRVAEFIVFLRGSNMISNLDDVHIVGFSLGGHVAGVAAYAAATITGEKIGRISGLDPAGPGFANLDMTNRLDASDATFVDIIHTNMGKLITTFGTPFKSGHVDFYPNGGEHQPGCVLPLVGEIVGVCSHMKAVDYFTNSILGKKYMGCPCTNYQTFSKGSCQCSDGPIMGEFIEPGTTGDYYLTIPLGQ